MLDVNSCSNVEVLPDPEPYTDPTLVGDYIVDVVDLAEYYNAVEEANMSCWDSVSK